jgi:hypothetical protein
VLTASATLAPTIDSDEACFSGSTATASGLSQATRGSRRQLGLGAKANHEDPDNGPIRSPSCNAGAVASERGCHSVNCLPTGPALNIRVQAKGAGPTGA